MSLIPLCALLSLLSRVYKEKKVDRGTALRIVLPRDAQAEMVLEGTRGGEG